MRAEAISLDIWGTLLRSDPDFKPARNEMLRHALAADVDPDFFDEALRTMDREADEICMARGTDVGFAERVQLTLAHLARPAAEHADQVAHPADIREDVVRELMEQQAQMAREHHPIALDDRIPALVAELAETRPVILTSNTGMLPGVLMRDLLALAGFTGNLGMVFSNEVGWAKPDRRIFEKTLTLAEATNGERIASSCVVHVGDNPLADEQGARDAGMTAVLVVPDGKSTVDALEALR